MVFRLPFGGINGAYNALGAIAVALNLGIERKIISNTFENFVNIKADDEIIEYKNKTIKIKTISNPTSLSVTLRELHANKNTKVIFCLNDDETDGIDTSWIWDANFNSLSCFEKYRLAAAPTKYNFVKLRDCGFAKD